MTKSDKNTFSMSQIRVLIVEDEPVVATDIAQCLAALDYIVYKALTVAKAHHYLETAYPDIALLDINLEGHQEGIELARLIREKYHLPFVFLTSYADKNTIQEAKKAQPSGYIVKPFDEQDLYAALEIALFNHAQSNKGLLATLTIEQVNKKLDETMALKPREFEALVFIIEGHTNPQIAEKMFLSVNTVKTHLKNLFSKLDVNSRTAAVNRVRDWIS
jgi:DNA-binding NarL/FixJ family response regulator